MVAINPNGKLRGKVMVAATADEQTLEAARVRLDEIRAQNPEA